MVGERTTGSQIGGLKSVKGSEFLLDGYITLGEPRNITIGGSSYSLQCFQGEHEDEYTLKKDGRVCLFKNGVLKMSYEVDEHDSQIGDFTYFENGCAAFVQSSDDIWDRRHFRRITNHVQGERMEIWSVNTDHLLYHGEFNDRREMEGHGIQYDEQTGAMLLEGIWKEDKLVEILRRIEGNIMTEFKRNGDNTLAQNRIPVYVGEFKYDESKESFLRNGRGYLIDETTRIATREGEWRDGKEVSGRDLFDGWYTPPPKPKPKPSHLLLPLLHTTFSVCIPSLQLELDMPPVYPILVAKRLRCMWKGRWLSRTLCDLVESREYWSSQKNTYLMKTERLAQEGKC